jgi:hypothetical protein
MIGRSPYLIGMTKTKVKGRLDDCDEARSGANKPSAKREVEGKTFSEREAVRIRVPYMIKIKAKGRINVYGRHQQGDLRGARDWRKFGVPKIPHDEICTLASYGIILVVAFIRHVITQKTTQSRSET